MYQQAVQKLRTEIEQGKNKQFVQVVGSFLLGHLEKYPQDANKIMVADKTITKSIDEMWKVATTKKVDNSAGMTGDEGMAIVFKYYGIGTAVDISVMSAAPTENIQKEIATPKKSEVDFDISLDDFL